MLIREIKQFFVAQAEGDTLTYKLGKHSRYVYQVLGSDGFEHVWIGAILDSGFKVKSIRVQQDGYVLTCHGPERHTT